MAADRTPRRRSPETWAIQCQPGSETTPAIVYSTGFSGMSGGTSAKRSPSFRPVAARKWSGTTQDRPCLSRAMASSRVPCTNSAPTSGRRPGVPGARPNATCGSSPIIITLSCRVTELPFRLPVMSSARRGCSTATGRHCSATTPGMRRTVSISASGSPPDWSVTSMSGTQSPGLNGCSIEYPQIIIVDVQPQSDAHGEHRAQRAPQVAAELGPQEPRLQTHAPGEPRPDRRFRGNHGQRRQQQEPDGHARAAQGHVDAVAGGLGHGHDVDEQRIDGDRIPLRTAPVFIHVRKAGS